MRRADRLFQIVQLLRRRRTTTAAQLAARLEVSERTIYRDIADLTGSGVPILGEAGVGYQLGREFELPPLMLNVEETRALVLGARMVQSWADDDLRRAAQSAVDKIQAVLPPRERRLVDHTALFAPSFQVPDRLRQAVGVLRRCIDSHHKVDLEYVDREGVASHRTICPLGLYFWGTVWTVGGWCELRADYRSFRLDRITNATRLDDRFASESPYTIEDFVANVVDRDRD
ncbi:MAG: YafY family transcriptional regulator [Myxococcales bacterium FL481]|nr:MAG: YafY family transcriptional regulator [Myxococcales bacterium FL481]